MQAIASAPQAQYANLHRRATIATIVVILVCLLGMAYQPSAAKSQPIKQPIQPASRPLGQDPRFASLANVEVQLQRMRTARRLKRPMPASLPSHVRERAHNYRPLVEQYAARYDLPPELILAIIERESMFDPDARSPANAIGLMQIIPSQGGHAAGRYTRQQTDVPTIDDLLDPETNIHYGTAYVRLLMDHYLQDVHDEDVRLALALAAYNWGPGNLRQVLQQQSVPLSLYEVETLLGEHAPLETYQFVRRITRRMPAYS